jgi:hypothetical protein
VEQEEGEITNKVRESLEDTSDRTTRCGAGFEDSDVLDSHMSEAHHPKRTVTVSDIIDIVFDGKINFPKTKAELVKEAERNKDNKPKITPEIIDIVRSLPDKGYNSQADLA